MNLSLPAALAAAVAVLVAGGCGRQLDDAYSETGGSGEFQAILEVGDSGGMPFYDEQGVVAVIYGSRPSSQLVIHAGSDLDRDLDRLTIAMVFDLSDPDLPGTVDLAHHSVILMELDRSGEPRLVLDGPPSGTAEILGALDSGREVDGTFSAIVPGVDELGDPLVARLDGTFSAWITSVQ